MTEMTLAEMQQMIGRSVYDSQHQRIGWIDEIFVDEATRTPEWIGIGEGLRREKHLVPVEGTRIEGDGLTVPYAKDQVDGTPDIPGHEVSVEQERELYRSYGMDYSQAASRSGLGSHREGTAAPRLRRYGAAEPAAEHPNGASDG